MGFGRGPVIGVRIQFGELWVVSSELWTAGSGEETCGRGDGGVGDPRRTSCGRREAGRGRRPRFVVGELTTDDTDRHGRMKERRTGPWMSPREVGSRQQNGASMLEQKVTKVTKGES